MCARCVQEWREVRQPSRRWFHVRVSSRGVWEALLWDDHPQLSWTVLHHLQRPSSKVPLHRLLRVSLWLPLYLLISTNWQNTPTQMPTPGSDAAESKRLHLSSVLFSYDIFGSWLSHFWHAMHTFTFSLTLKCCTKKCHVKRKPQCHTSEKWKIKTKQSVLCAEKKFFLTALELSAPTVIQKHQRGKNVLYLSCSMRTTRAGFNVLAEAKLNLLFH